MKTFGQLRAGDEVYIIKGNSVEIVNVQRIEEIKAQSGGTVPRRPMVFATIGNTNLTLCADQSFFYDIHSDTVGDIYCDLCEAFREMKRRCDTNFRAYKASYEALLTLEACIPRYHKN